jgi:hexulose-6-phosphate isomerase
MKIGVTQIILGGMSLDETLALCQDAGYEAVELTFRAGKDLRPDLTASELEAIAKKCAAAGVEIASVIASGSAGGNLLSPDPNEQAAGRERVRRSVEIGGILGVNCTLLHPGQLGVGGTYDGAWRLLRNALIELAPIAEKNRCAVGVENVWNKFLLSPREMAQFVDDVGSDWVGAYLDTANMMAYGYPEQWVRGLGKRIKKVHFKDFSRSKGQFTNLMDGDTDWKTLVAELRVVGYDDAVIHEVGGNKDELIETARRMRQIVAM